MKIISLILLLIALPVSVYLVGQAQQYASRASGTPATIIVETKTGLGAMPTPWLALAQGGEEVGQTLNGLTSLIKPLAPKYVRIDHLYDFYQVVNGEKNGKMTYDFSKLDIVVNNILAMGAKPLFSLSYMPPVITSGSITDKPTHWSDWQDVVRATVNHYSGKNQKNIEGVIYEVWNEPDLFGHWKTYGDKDYRLLYAYAVKGAALAENVNSFQIGGPATTSFYKSWFEDFFKYVYQNNLRLDFVSWHRYSYNPQDFLTVTDINNLDSLLIQNGGSNLLPKYITEWGSDPENTPVHDSVFDAAHTIAIVRQILDKINLAFTFEIKDGPSPNNNKLWGRWGILASDSTPKPRYFALKLLNKMTGNRLQVNGEGTWVTGIAVKEDKTIRILLVNYDRESSHVETFPVTFNGLEVGEYNYSTTDLYGKTTTFGENIAQGTLTKMIYLPVNSVVLLELSPK